MSVRTWRCRKTTKGIVCGTLNLRRKQRCTKCGGPRPKPRTPAHRAVLATITYDECVAIYGERCGICGTAPKPGKKLHRDHEHKGAGRIRGLLCFRCNAALRTYMDAAWLRAAATYLERGGVGQGL
jgi:hypothetical protein